MRLLNLFCDLLFILAIIIIILLFTAVPVAIITREYDFIMGRVFKATLSLSAGFIFFYAGIKIQSSGGPEHLLVDKKKNPIKYLALALPFICAGLFLIYIGYVSLP